MLVTPLAVVAQLLVVALPAAEAASGRDSSRSAGAHVEETGSRAHYAHSDTGCAACAAHQSSASVESATTPAAARGLAVPHASSTDRRSSSLLFSTYPPRAPPVLA